MEKLLKLRDVMREYGLSEYQARNLMIRSGRVNIGASDDFPRWAVTASAIDCYLRSQSEEQIIGLDSAGKLVRR